MKNINVNQLQSKASQVVKEAESGEVFRVMRYGKPMAAIIPYSDYESLKENCQKCVVGLREDLEKLVKERK